MKLVILGAGGFAREALGWVLQSCPQYNHITFYDRNSNGKEHIFAYPVVNRLDFEWMRGLNFLPAVGDPSLRKGLYEMAVAHGLVPCHPIVHPSVVTGLQVEVGLGSIICPGSVLTTNIKIGKGFLGNLNTTVGHDAQLGDFVTLNPGVSVSGNCQIGDRVLIGTGAVLREKIKIASDSTIGMGAVVIKDCVTGTYIGNPARPLTKILN
jgi:sugar O-acyltransferase (sialic acid O-acetyltransferase NeuD family)